MKRSTSEKPFDCIEYKRRVQQEIYEKIKDMSAEQEIEFFRRAAEEGPFAKLVRAVGAQEKKRESNLPTQRSVPTQKS